MLEFKFKETRLLITGKMGKNALDMQLQRNLINVHRRSSDFICPVAVLSYKLNPLTGEQHSEGPRDTKCVFLVHLTFTSIFCYDVFYGQNKIG